MNSDWPPVRLGDLIDVAHGWAFKGSHFCDPAPGLPIVVKPGNFRQTGGLNFGYGRTQAFEGEYPPEFELQPGDLLVVMTCQTPGGEILGVPGVVPDGDVRLLHNQRLGKVTIHDAARCDGRFLYWLLNDWSVRRKLVASASGSTVLHTSPSRIEEVEVHIPRLAEQHRMAWVLDSLDDKIESNRRIAETLEQTAATLFKACFIDFVDHDDLVESEIGPIPRGWGVAPIGEALTVVGGTTPSTKEPRFWDGGIHCWATPKDLSGLRSPILLDTARHITDAGVEQISSKLLTERTVLLSSRAPVGYTAICAVPVAVNQGFIAIPPSDVVPPEYILFWLRENLEQIRAHAGGTTFAEISKRAFRPLPMLVPPAEELEAFQRAATPTIDLIAGVERQTGELSAIRDALLPRLISGQLRVPPHAFPDTEAA